MAATGAFELPEDLLQQAVRVSRGRTQQEVVIEALQEYIQHHQDERQRAAAIEDGLALLLIGDLDHPDRDSAWALTCLLDTSVWNRLDRAPALAAEVTTLFCRSEVGYTDIERLEVLRSARHIDDYRRLAVMFAALPKVALTEAAILRAGQVQEQLVLRGHHRGVKIPDLLIAAAATAAPSTRWHTER